MYIQTESIEDRVAATVSKKTGKPFDLIEKLIKFQWRTFEEALGTDSVRVEVTDFFRMQIEPSLLRKRIIKKEIFLINLEEQLLNLEDESKRPGLERVRDYTKEAIEFLKRKKDEYNRNLKGSNNRAI